MERKFIVVTSDFVGLGLAIDEKKAGSKVIVAYSPKECEIPDDWKVYKNVGKGLVDTVPLEKLFEKRKDFKNWYWIWDGNHNTDVGETLKKEGFKVLGGTEYTFNLENDRELGIKIAEEVGFSIPEHAEFSSVEDGIKFLEEHEDEAYVYKPNNEDSAYTTVPMTEEAKSANIEIRQLIQALGFTDYILQKRVKGVEVNVESTYLNGVPQVTYASLEDKRLHNGDLGSAAGCSFEIVFIIPSNCELAQMTVRKFDKMMAEKNYIGFMDCNVIISDFNEVNFIEFCARMGWSSHPNIWKNLSSKSLLQYCADLIDGKFETHFKKGFGASMNVFCDHYKQGLPIYVPETLEDKFYIYDGYMEDDILKMSGYGKDIGLILAHNYTPESALEECLYNANKIKFSNIYYRTDVQKKDFNNSPVKRYEALQNMGVL
jgi:phosphoribosylamine-glycine ligase